MRPLNYGRHLIDENDINAVIATLRGDLITQGPIVEEFEKALAEKVGAKYAVAVSSGTAALHVACLAAGLKPGMRGVTSALTFVASANAILYCGANAGLCDIDPETLCLNPDALEKYLEQYPDTSVVIPVHFSGLAANSRKIRELAGNRIIIEDAAHALGASYECGRPVGCGAYADMTIFSFHPVKPITTGEGGAIVTNDLELANKLRLFRTHGIERDIDKLESPDEALEEGARRTWYYEQQYLGYNYRLTDIQAALGLSQLNKLDRFIDVRRSIAKQYDEHFQGLKHLKISQQYTNRDQSGHHLYIVEFDFGAIGRTRHDVMKVMRGQGICPQVHYIPVYRQPYYANKGDYSRNSFPNTEAYYKACLSLPIFPGMTYDEVLHVVNVVRDISE